VSRSQKSGKSGELRDVDADYKAAYVDEYRSYKQAGRHEDAARVAAILRDRYGVDVDAAEAEAPVQRPEPGEAETTAAAPPPEAAVEPKPAAQKAPARKTAAKKTAPAKPQE
jgi:hypothetical protein